MASVADPVSTNGVDIGMDFGVPVLVKTGMALPVGVVAAQALPPPVVLKFTISSKLAV